MLTGRAMLTCCYTVRTQNTARQKIFCHWCSCFSGLELQQQKKKRKEKYSKTTMTLWTQAYQWEDDDWGSFIYKPQAPDIMPCAPDVIRYQSGRTVTSNTLIKGSRGHVLPRSVFKLGHLSKDFFFLLLLLCLGCTALQIECVLSRAQLVGIAYCFVLPPT